MERMINCERCKIGKFKQTITKSANSTITSESACIYKLCKSHGIRDKELELADTINKLHEREQKVFQLLTKHLKEMEKYGICGSRISLEAQQCNVEFAKKVIEEIG